MQRYALMESKQYQNIPRTIQNVLLNSKLDAEFIKKTIISSLNEEDTSVDLNTYKEHLKNFETRLRDIEEFQKRETQKQAAEITRLATEVNRDRLHWCKAAGNWLPPASRQKRRSPNGKKRKNRQKTTGISYWPAAWNCRSSQKRNVTGCRKCWLLSTMNCRKLLRKEKGIRPAEHFPDCRTVSQKGRMEKPPAGTAGRAAYPHLTVYGNLYQIQVADPKSG